MRLLQRIRDWFRAQKMKYLYRQGGPRDPSKDTDLYFDWRRHHQRPRQDHTNIHPGTHVYG